MIFVIFQEIYLGDLIQFRSPYTGHLWVGYVVKINKKKRKLKLSRSWETSLTFLGGIVTAPYWWSFDQMEDVEVLYTEN